jgi:prepilin-type N-terminal cleavage/methylation domain-containing protein
VVKNLRRRRGDRGMTMMEVMMAIIVATIGLLGSLAMMSLLYRTSTYSRNLSEAMALVQQKLESEVSRGAITLTSPANGTLPLETVDGLGNASASGLYTRTTTWGPSTDNKRRNIKVQVTFQDNAGIQHTVLAERERNIP